jgi:hypothetical protein
MKRSEVTSHSPKVVGGGFSESVPSELDTFSNPGMKGNAVHIIHRASAGRLYKLISDQPVTLEWGEGGKYVFHKEKNAPILLICFGEHTPFFLTERPFEGHFRQKRKWMICPRLLNLE